MTGLGKNKGIPVNQKVQEKVRDTYKRLYTLQVKNPKGRLGKKWVSWWTENTKRRSRQKLGIKVYDYVLLDQSQPDLLPTKSSNGTDRFSQLCSAARDEMLKDIWAIAELKSDEIIYT